MIRRSFDRRGIGLVLLSLLAAGCASSGGATDDPAPRSGMRVQTAPSDLVELPTPSVSADNNLLTVAGVVRRKPGAAGTFDGHVELIFLDKTGGEADMIPLSLTPRVIPADGSRQARYRLSYACTVPPGTTLRIEYTEDDAIDPDSVHSLGGTSDDIWQGRSNYSRTRERPSQPGSRNTRSNSRGALGSTGSGAGGGARSGMGGGMSGGRR